MKNFWSIVLLLLAAILIVPKTLGYSSYTQAFYFSECDKPFKYNIGQIDKKYGVTEEEFKKDIEESGNIWEKEEGKDLFEYDPNAQFTINFVYDERQALNSQISKLKGNLENKQSEIKPEIADFQKRSQDFSDRLNELNKQIDYWNQQGGAPDEEYKKLVDEQNSLRDEAKVLNDQAKTLNQSTKSYNADVKNLNQTITNFNEVITEKPEEGLYDPTQNKIDIYFNNSKNELVHTLAHEMGHALGMQHNSNKSSIMYSFTSEKLTPTPEDIAELNNVCKKNSLTDILQQRLGLYYLYFQQQYNNINANN